MDENKKKNFKKEFKRENNESYKDSKKNFKRDRNKKDKEFFNKIDFSKTDIDPKEQQEKSFNIYCKKARATWVEDGDNFEFRAVLNRIPIVISNKDEVDGNVCLLVHSIVKYKIPFIYNKLVSVVNKTNNFMDYSILENYLNKESQSIKILNKEPLDKFKRFLNKYVPEDHVEEFRNELKDNYNFTKVTREITDTYRNYGKKKKFYRKNFDKYE